MTDPGHTPQEPRTKAGRETHTLLHRLSSQMKSCEMVPCPFAGLVRKAEWEAARQDHSDIQEMVGGACTGDENCPLHRAVEAEAAAHTHDETTAEREHTEGEPHEYRITCRVCGEQGTVRLSIEPQVAPSGGTDG